MRCYASEHRNVAINRERDLVTVIARHSDRIEARIPVPVQLMKSKATRDRILQQLTQHLLCLSAQVRRKRVELPFELLCEIKRFYAKAAGSHLVP